MEEQEYEGSYEDHTRRSVEDGVRAAEQKYKDGVYREVKREVATDIKQAVTEGLTEALTPRPQVPPALPWGDDPVGEERKRLTADIAELKEKAEKASPGETREPFSRKAYLERLATAERDLAKLGPTPEEKYREDYRADLSDKAVEALYDEKHIDDPVWDDPRMQHDAPIEVCRANARAKTIIRLPVEVSPHGGVESCRPSNMCKLELPEDVVRRFKQMVYQQGGDQDADSVLRRSWQALHKMGYAGAATRAFPEQEEKAPKGKEKGQRDPAKMTFKEFEKWRESQGAKRF